MSEVKIAERWKAAHSVWSRADMQGHEVVASQGVKLIEELSAVESALAEAKAERDTFQDALFTANRHVAENVQRCEELEAENARLRAPVSDEELTPHLLGKKWPITEAFDALIAARSQQPTTPAEQERPNPKE